MDVEREPLITTSRETPNRRWSKVFWLMLKILSTFHHKTLVSERKCFACKVKEINRRTRNLRMKGKDGDVDLDCFLLTYEYDSCEVQEDTHPLNISSEEDQICEVCDTLWWNYNRKSVRYTEKEIGVSRWNHCGSGYLSQCVILLTISIIVYDILSLLPKMWARQDQALHLVIKGTLFTYLLTYPVMCLCSKFRSFFGCSVPYFTWASTLNARYIVKRGQYLDLSRKGIPGRPFFIVCTCAPLAIALYRSCLFIFLSECEVDIHALATSVIGVILLEMWGFFVYLMYLLRVSFQRQFTLILSYFKEHEGETGICRGVLASAAPDFSCFKEFTCLYVMIMVPIGLIALTTMIIWEYMLTDTCVADDEHLMSVQNHHKRVAWLEMTSAFFLLVAALGGVQVSYLWRDLRFNIVQLRSNRHADFWDTLHRDACRLFKEDNILLATICSSVIGIYIALQFGDQNVAYLVHPCNISNITSNDCF